MCDKQWFTFAELNERIKNISLTGRDAANSTVLLVNDKTSKVRGQAMEIFYFIRLLPILLHDKVIDCEYDVWNLYLTLKLIVIVMSPKLHVTQAEYLRVLSCRALHC